MRKNIGIKFLNTLCAFINIIIFLFVLIYLLIWKFGDSNDSEYYEPEEPDLIGFAITIIVFWIFSIILSVIQLATCNLSHSKTIQIISGVVNILSPFLIGAGSLISGGLALGVCIGSKSKKAMQFYENFYEKTD